MGGRLNRPLWTFETAPSVICPLPPHLSLSVDEPLGGAQLLQAHRASGVELLGGNADLGSQAELEAVGEPGGAVYINRRRRSPPGP